jgi:Lipoprotein amino terminal region
LLIYLNFVANFSQVIVDSLVLTGTNPALMIVRDLILKGRITGEQAVQAVSFLAGNVKTPTKELITSFIVSSLTILCSPPTMELVTK